MEATVAERGQITLPKAVRDALGLTKGTILKVELDGGDLARTRSLPSRRLRVHRRRHARPAWARPRRSARPRRRHMIAIDSSVLVDLLADGPWADATEACLRQCLGIGTVVVCDVALAEVCSALKDGSEAVAVLEEVGIRFSALEAKSALRAGEMQRRHRQRGGAPARAVPDFLIGAHALLQCDGLITRDDRFYRDYFKGLKLIVPTPE
jgi:AbrB family looped-hinge helix DNA binding protein